MPVKTTRLSAPPTQQLLSPEAQRTGRIVAAGLVALLVLSAIVLDIHERRQATQRTEPVYIMVILTPTPQPPLPTATPLPTAQPVVIVQTVEVPVYVEVQAVPVVEAPPTYQPPTEAPAVIGEVISWDGEVQQVAP